MSVERIHQELETSQKSVGARQIVIPPCPELLVQLQAAMRSKEPDWAQLDRIINADVAMSAALLRHANSPIYALNQPVQTIGQALTILGWTESQKILLQLVARGTFSSQSPVLLNFWDQSTRRGVICEYLSERLYAENTHLSYLFGLFCHVGMPIMMQRIKGYASTLVEALARQDRSFTETENVNHKTDHAVVGALTAKAWLLPIEVVAAIKWHHDFSVLKDSKLPAPVRQLVAIGLVADGLAARFDHTPDPAEWSAHGQACLNQLGISQSELSEWDEDLADRLAGT